VKKFGKYTVKGLLGRGGMGMVYKAAIPNTEKIVALKVCQPRQVLVNILGIKEVRRQFMKEAVTMARLRHPNIAEVWDLDTHNGRPFFVMEYYCNNLGTVIGETYEDAPSRTLSIDASIQYTRQALAALARLHHAGIIHMDVKPFNMMLTDEGVVKMIDFGVSKLRGEELGGPDTIKVGTPYYSAPEQEENPNQADERSDLYSVGITLFRMLTGSLPDENKVAANINPELDEEWERFLKKATHPDRKARFTSAGNMLAELDLLAAAWEDKKAKTCILIEEESLPKKLRRAAGSATLRSVPIKTGLKRARDFFEADELWRPKNPVSGVLRDKADGTILDVATNLLWEQGGSPYPGTWNEAQDYVNSLNAKIFAGFSDWRLPTVNELMSLFIENLDPYQFCLEPVFDPDKQRIWSADKKSYVAAWYADVEFGFVWWQDFTCFFHARAVRSAKGID
jgi:serine/threonine protein kinase